MAESVLHPVSAEQNHTPYCRAMNNVNAASYMLIAATFTTSGTSFIVNINRRGSYHSIHQAVIGAFGNNGATPTNVDVVTTAGNAITAEAVAGGIKISVPSYSSVSVLGFVPFTLSDTT